MDANGRGSFPFGDGLFSGAFAVSFRDCIVCMDTLKLHSHCIYAVILTADSYPSSSLGLGGVYQVGQAGS